MDTDDHHALRLVLAHRCISQVKQTSGTHKPPIVGRPAAWRSGDRRSAPLALAEGNVVPPTGKSFDLEFGQTSKWQGDQLIVIAAFWDAALQARQLGMA